VILARPRQLNRTLTGAPLRLSLVIFLPIMGSLVWGGTLPAKGPSKELPMQVTVSDLAAEPEQL
jgi:hypothetical protein